MSGIHNEQLAKFIFENNIIGVQEQLALGVRTNGFCHYDFAEQTRLYDTMVTIAVKHALDTEILKLLISADFDLNETDDEDLTPLMIAADRDNLEAVQLLVEAGANVDLRDRSGCTALMRASKKGKLFLLTVLTQRCKEGCLVMIDSIY